MIFIENAPSYAFVEYINEPYTAVVPLRLLQGSSLKESEIVEVQKGKMNYSHLEARCKCKFYTIETC